MKKFIIKPTMGTMVEELAVVTLPSCCTAEKKDNEIVIFTPNGVAEAMANVITSLLIDGTVCHWSSCENKVILSARLPTCVKLLSSASGQEILFTKEVTGINGFMAVTPEPSRTVLRTTPKREN